MTRCLQNGQAVLAHTESFEQMVSESERLLHRRIPSHTFSSVDVHCATSALKPWIRERCHTETVLRIGCSAVSGLWAIQYACFENFETTISSTREARWFECT